VTINHIYKQEGEDRKFRILSNTTHISSWNYFSNAFFRNPINLICITNSLGVTYSIILKLNTFLLCLPLYAVLTIELVGQLQRI